MFTHNLLDLPELERKNIGGKRHYHVDGEWYPSVTTALSAKEEPASLKAWKKRLGPEKAKAVMKQAATRGEKLHDVLEKYVLNQDIDYKKVLPSTMEMFQMLKPLLDENVTDIFAIERPVFSKQLGIAGRLDLGAKWCGDNAIIDFKSSTKPKKREWIDNYFMQESLYGYMLFEMRGIFIPKIVTLVATPGEPTAQVFVERTADWLPKAIDLVGKFYEQQAAESE